MSSPCLLDGKAVMADRLASFAVPLEPDQLPSAIDVIVRVVLSHIMAPSDSPATAVEDITWLASRRLAAEALVVSPAVWPPEPPEVLGRHLPRLVGSSLGLTLDEELQRPQSGGPFDQRRRASAADR